MSEKRLFLGIDPGQTGGLGIVDAAGRFYAAHRWNKTDPRHIYNILYLIKDMIIEIYIENVNLPTTGAGLEGAGAWAGSGNLLVNSGIWQGFLIGLGLPFCQIAPATWLAAQGLHHWKKKLEHDPAGLSPLTMARSRWPQAPLEFKADDGKAVGLLLSDLARRDAQGGVDRRAMQEKAQSKKVAKRRQAREIRKNGLASDISW
jgi:hypothetical protein